MKSTTASQPAEGIWSAHFMCEFYRQQDGSRLLPMNEDARLLHAHPIPISACELTRDDESGGGRKSQADKTFQTGQSIGSFC